MVSGRRSRRRAQPRASRLCKHFAGGNLAVCARAGLASLRATHQRLIVGGDQVGCSVDLDRCRLAAEAHSYRWDYVLVPRVGDRPGVGMEVHHASADEVNTMCQKKAWAESLLKREAPALAVQRWCWIVPEGGCSYLAGNAPQLRALAAAGIESPQAVLRFG